MKITTRCGEAAVAALNEALLAKAVEAKVLSQGRDRKKIVFKYHRKTRYRKKKGHRQPFTEVEIQEIGK